MSAVSRTRGGALAHTGALLWVLVAVGVAYAATYRGEVSSADEAYMFGVTHNIAEQHTLAIDQNGDDGAGDLRWLNERVQGAQVGPDGRLYSKLGVGQSLLGLPLYLGGKRLLDGDTAKFAGYPIGPLGGVRGAMALGSVLGLLTVAGTYVLACLLGAGWRGAVCAALATGVGSMLWPYAKTYFSEPATAFTLTWAVVALVAHSRRPGTWKMLLAGAALLLCVLTRPFNLVVYGPALLFALWITWRPSARGASGAARRGVVALVMLGAISVVAVVGYASLRYGSPLATGYGPNEGFRHSIAQGVEGFLISPGKSILLFNPFTVLAPFGAFVTWRARRAETLLIVATVALYVVLYSAWWAWEGGWAWGPRFLLPIVPLLAALAAPIFERFPAIVAVAVLVVSGAMQVVGSLYDPISSIGEVIGAKLPEAQYPWSRDHSYAVTQFQHVLKGDHPDSLFFAHHGLPLAWLWLLALVALASLVVVLPSRTDERVLLREHRAL